MEQTGFLLNEFASNLRKGRQDVEFLEFMCEVVSVCLWVVLGMVTGSTPTAHWVLAYIGARNY